MKGNSIDLFRIPLIIFGILSYFVYGNLQGVLAIILLYILMSICSPLSVIPIIGWIATILIDWYIIIPQVLSFTGIGMTWLVGLIFIYELIAGFIITIYVLLLVIAKIYE